MSVTRKMVTFDLDTKALQKYYPKAFWQNAYEDIKKYMVKNDFEWHQGSVYISRSGVNAEEVSETLKILIKNNPWINVCMRDCEMSSLIKEHDMNNLFDHNADVPERNALPNKRMRHDQRMDSGFGLDV